MIPLVVNWQKLIRDSYAGRLIQEIQCNKDLIFEKYCVYDGQYDDAKCITEIIGEMIKNEKSEYKKKWNNNESGFEYINIKIISSPTIRTAASCKLQNKTLNITVFLNAVIEWDNRMGYKNTLETIEATLAHELSHGHIDSKRNAVDKYDWYKVSSIILNDNGSNLSDEEYRFVAGLYYTFYHEIQAFASEITPSIVSLLSRENLKPTGENLVNCLKQTTPFIVYGKYLMYFVEEMKNYNQSEISKIAEYYKKHDENLGNDIERHFNKYVEIIENGSKRAMVKIRQNFNYVLEKYDLI